MYEVIASPFLGDYLLVRPGHPAGFKIPLLTYLELERRVGSVERCPAWLVDPVRRAWGVDVASRRLNDTVLVRARTPYGYGRASYELNLGCNYDCEHCYLGLKKFEGLAWPDRHKLLHILCDAGVLWLQLTGGEPLIDKLFPETYQLAYDLGMMLSISSNGSRLSNPAILDLLVQRRPYRLTLSVYGATADSYDGLTRRRGAFAKFTKGLAAAHEAGLPINLNLVVANRNAHEVDAMKAMAERLGLPYMVYVNMSPTIYGTGEVLVTQSEEHLRKRKVFTGCNAGHTFFHVDPHGNASICKVGRDPNIPLIEEGVEGLHRLGTIADSLMLRTGGCSGCALLPARREEVNADASG
jgi:uncharacterized Fe-S cluster-containing radical SAM superfamily protein